MPVEKMGNMVKKNIRNYSKNSKREGLLSFLQAIDRLSLPRDLRPVQSDYTFSNLLPRGF